MNFHGGQYKKVDLFDFSVNIPPVSFEASYRNLLIEAIQQLVEYPEIDGVTARLALSKHLELPLDDIVLGNGATDLIYLIARALKFERAMILNPTFSEYRRALVQTGAKVTDYVMTEKTNDKTLSFELNAHKLAKAIAFNKCQTLFICNPNNPTGQLFSTDFIETLLSETDKNFVLIIDESFIEFRSRVMHHTKMRELIMRYNILVIRSMTKTYSVPGLRMGYAFGSANLMKALNNYRDPWALNRFALESIPYFLERKTELAALQAVSQTSLEEMRKALMNLEGIHVAESEANFLLIKVSFTDPVAWHERMIEKGYYLRTCMDFLGLGPEYFRIAVIDKTSNHNLIKAIRETIR